MTNTSYPPAATAANSSFTASAQPAASQQSHLPPDQQQAIDKQENVHSSQTGNNQSQSQRLTAAQMSHFMGINRSAHAQASIVHQTDSTSAISREPKCRIDLSDRFEVSKTDWLALSTNEEAGHDFRYGTLDHGLLACLNTDGVLSFHVTSKPDLRATNGGGRDMFISLIRRLSREGLDVNSVHAEWVGKPGAGVSVNLDKYVENRKTMSEDAAVKATWTGQLVAEFGFSEATITHPLVRAGSDDLVEVLFKKP